MTYAATLEKQAWALASKLVQQDLEQLQSIPEQHAAAATLYRKAAGVYNHASEQYVSQLSGDNQADRCSHLATTQVIVTPACFCPQHGMCKTRSLNRCNLQVLCLLYPPPTFCNTLLALQTSRIDTWHGCCPLKDGTGTSAGNHCPSCTGQEYNAICSCISVLRGHRYDSIFKPCSARRRSQGAYKTMVLAWQTCLKRHQLC